MYSPNSPNLERKSLESLAKLRIQPYSNINWPSSIQFLNQKKYTVLFTKYLKLHASDWLKCVCAHFLSLSHMPKALCAHNAATSRCTGSTLQCGLRVAFFAAAMRHIKFLISAEIYRKVCPSLQKSTDFSLQKGVPLSAPSLQKSTERCAPLCIGVPSLHISLCRNLQISLCREVCPFLQRGAHFLQK